MEDLAQHIFTFLMLTLLQAVLGFDNLLYISIESKRVEESKQSFVRKWGIGLAIFLRITLLFAVTAAISRFSSVFWSLHTSAISFDLTVHSLIVLIGGGFVIYTAVKEISHMLADSSLSDHNENGKRTVGVAMFWIVTMNMVFSFDSILSAIALAATKNKETDATEITTAAMIVMSLAIISSGVMMIWLSDRVSNFLKKNRLYEVLGLFILFIVGIMLVSEGGELAKVHLAGHEVHAMAKSTFYFVLAVLVIVDIVQGRFQKKLLAQQAAREAAAAEATGTAAAS